jgi:hypothetical protein
MKSIILLIGLSIGSSAYAGDIFVEQGIIQTNNRNQEYFATIDNKALELCTASYRDCKIVRKATKSATPYNSYEMTAYVVVVYGEDRVTNIKL